MMRDDDENFLHENANNIIQFDRLFLNFIVQCLLYLFTVNINRCDTFLH